MSRVLPGYVMSARLFCLAVDWVMHRTTEDQARGIQWTLLSTLDDLDYADDITLFSHA